VEDVVTMAIMLFVAFLVSDLTADLRSQAAASRQRERRAGVLYALTADLAKAQSADDVARIAARHIADEFRGRSVLLFAEASGALTLLRDDSPLSYRSPDMRIAQWVFNNARPAGRGTDTMPESEAVYFPMVGGAGPFGVLAIAPANLRRVFLPEQRRLIDTFVSQIAQATERLRLMKETQAAKLAVEAESLRNSLLSAIAHDFRTPLASILTASSGLLDRKTKLSEPETRELTETVYEEAQRMTRLANNILQMARLEGGVVRLNREWYPIDEIVGGVLARLNARLAHHQIDTRLPEELQLIKVDAVMIEQVFENLVENAVKYTPPGTRIELGASVSPSTASFWVADEGPGLRAGQEELVFQKFYRGAMEGAQSGAGLGLTICRAIVHAHGGEITAGNRARGGAEFRFTIPLTEQPPQFLPEEESAV